MHFRSVRSWIWIASTFLVASLAGCSCGGGDGATPSFDGSLPDTGAGDGGTIVRPDSGPREDAGMGGDEVCGNGLDDDGDGAVDEDCFCVPGEMASCFGGPAESRGVGRCVDGTMVCEDALEFGTWGDCAGDVMPETEVCDTAGVDEDCDGAANEGCVCMDGDPPVACGSAVGACRPGTQDCVGGMLGECVGATGPVGEVCNNVDDDCDGMTDEGLTRACGSSVGECRPGTETCIAGVWECGGGRTPGVEDCNGLDDDCDGTVDEALSRSCGSAIGACTMGMQACSGGTWSTCTGGTLPGIETCNNVDDDCDGAIDDGVTRACGSSVGICRPGTETCSAGAWGTCTGGIGPSTETCDGVRDEDCDGTVDDGCGCTTGMTRACGTDTGECVRGTQTCDSAGMWGVCMGSVGPVPEVCDMRDNDCDGTTDEDGVCPTAPPVVTCPAPITANVLSTVSLSGSGSDPDGGAVTYRWTVRTRPTGSVANPASPTSATTTFFLDASGTYVIDFCVTDDEGQMACCSVTITSRPPGAIHVEVSWNTAYGDVDSHFLNVTRTPPAGWWTADDCHYQNRAPDWGAAGAVANPTLDIDDTAGYGPENTTINMSPASGRYHVGVHYFCDHSLPADGTGQGPTEATVRIFCDGALIATYERIALTRTDDWVTVASVDYPGCTGRSVNTRTTGRALLPSSYTSVRHCEIPCTTTADCPSGETCVDVVGGGGRRRVCYMDP